LSQVKCNQQAHIGAEPARALSCEQQTTK